MRFLALLLLCTSNVAALRGLTVESLQTLEEHEKPVGNIHKALRHEHGNEEEKRQESMEEILETRTFKKPPKPKPHPELKTSELVKDYLKPKGKESQASDEPKVIGKKVGNRYEFKNNGYSEDNASISTPKKSKDKSSDDDEFTVKEDAAFGLIKVTLPTTAFVYEYDSSMTPTESNFFMLTAVTDLVLSELFEKHFGVKQDFRKSEIDGYEALSPTIVKFDLHLYFENEAPTLEDIERLTREQLDEEYLDIYLESLQTSNLEVFSTTTSVVYISDQTALDELIPSEPGTETPKDESQTPANIEGEQPSSHPTKTSSSAKKIVPSVIALVAVVTLFALSARRRLRITHSHQVVNDVPENIMKHKDDLERNNVYGTPSFDDDDDVLKAYKHFRQKSRISDDLEDISLDGVSATSRTSGSGDFPITPNESTPPVRIPTLPKKDHDDSELPEWTSRSSGTDQVDSTENPPLPEAVSYKPSNDHLLSHVEPSRENRQQKFISASPRLVQVGPSFHDDPFVTPIEETVLQDAPPPILPTKKVSEAKPQPSLSIPELKYKDDIKKEFTDVPILESESVASKEAIAKHDVVESTLPNATPPPTLKKVDPAAANTSATGNAESKKPAWLTLKPKTPPQSHRKSFEEHTATPTRSGQPEWMTTKLLKTPKKTPSSSSTSSTPEPEWLQKFRQMREKDEDTNGN